MCKYKIADIEQTTENNKKRIDVTIYFFEDRKYTPDEAIEIAEEIQDRVTDDLTKFDIHIESAGKDNPTIYAYSEYWVYTEN